MEPIETRLIGERAWTIADYSHNEIAKHRCWIVMNDAGSEEHSFQTRQAAEQWLDHQQRVAERMIAATAQSRKALTPEDHKRRFRMAIRCLVDQFFKEPTDENYARIEAEMRRYQALITR